ncbi:hypothetical protein K438DRAFT_1994373 [Mycena galopus ATCC 62051]|nr:hypothetical protein K438DRAFT_1994373 [Mycena galopus ATCC 62051]
MTENGPARTPPPSKRIHDASVVSVSTCGRVPLQAPTTACTSVPLLVPLAHPHPHHHGHFLLPSADRIRALSSVDRDSRPRRYNRECGAAPASMRAEHSASVSARVHLSARASPPPPLNPCLSRRSLPTPSSPTTEERRGREHTHRPAHPVLALNAAAGHEECSSVDE